jgi:hypothetical protein
MVSLSGHVAAAIHAPDSQDVIWAEIMTGAHSRTGIWAVGAISALALFGMSASVARSFGADALQTASQLAYAAKSALSEGYRVAPALMLVLALAIASLVLAISMWIARHSARFSAETARRCRMVGDHGAPEAALTREATLLAHTGQPFVEIEAGRSTTRCAIAGDMLTIGRGDDNDIRIYGRTVHRYHAAIHREDDDWHITDLSGVEGAGLTVNGRRCGETCLSDGDLIRLGPSKLRFHARPE